GTAPPGPADAVVALVDPPPLDDDAVDDAPRVAPVPDPVAPDADAAPIEPPDASVAAASALPDASAAVDPADAPTRLALTSAVSCRGVVTEHAPASNARATRAMARLTRTRSRRRRPGGSRACGTPHRPGPGHACSCRARRPACSCCTRTTGGPSGQRTRASHPCRRGRRPPLPATRCSRYRRGPGCRWAS